MCGGVLRALNGAKFDLNLYASLVYSGASWWVHSTRGVFWFVHVGYTHAFRCSHHRPLLQLFC